MDWAAAIDRNRNALIAVVAAIFSMLGLESAGTVSRLPRHLHRRALRLLRPAESACRRLIVIAARGLAVQPLPAARSAPLAKTSKAPNPSRRRPPAFKLYDPRKRIAYARCQRSPGPRMTFFSHDPRVVALPRPFRPAAKSALRDDDGLMNAQPLCRRLQALQSALADVPRQAIRLMRWKARRERQQELRPVFTSPLRPGLPPGYRRKPTHDVDDILIACHGLAFDAMRQDTS
jgi:hypothetical protein